jgi:hypothetical protein
MMNGCTETPKKSRIVKLVAGGILFGFLCLILKRRMMLFQGTVVKDGRSYCRLLFQADSYTNAMKQMDMDTAPGVHVRVSIYNHSSVTWDRRDGKWRLLP